MASDVGTAAHTRGVGRYGAALSAARAHAAGVGAGDRAREVGCGPGVLLGELAGRLEPAQVAGVESAAAGAAAGAALPGSPCSGPAPRSCRSARASDVVMS